MSGTVYDLNKTIIGTMAPITSEESLQKQCETIKRLYEKTLNNHYMFFCREAGYFTLFQKRGSLTSEDFKNEVYSCIANLSTAVYRMDYNEEENSVEIWLKAVFDGQLHCFMLFPYDKAIWEIPEGAPYHGE